MDVDAEIRAEQEARRRGVALTDVIEDDSLAAGGGGGSNEYVAELRDEEEADDGRYGGGRSGASLAQRVIAAHALDAEGEGTGADVRAFGGTLAHSRVGDRETSEYKRAHRAQMTMSPDRGGDAFSGSTPARSYADILVTSQLAREKDDLQRKLVKQQQDAALVARAVAQSGAGMSAAAAAGGGAGAGGGLPPPAGAAPPKRRRWDQAAAVPVAPVAGASGDTGGVGAGGGTDGSRGGWVAGGGVGGNDGGSLALAAATAAAAHRAAAHAAAVSMGGGDTPVYSSGAGAGAGAGQRRNRWDEQGETPMLAGGGGGGVLGSGGETPMAGSAQWADSTPLVGSFSSSAAAAATAVSTAAGRKRSRWDETPAAAAAAAATPMLSSSFLATAAAAGMTPSVLGLLQVGARAVAETDARNQPLTDEELDAILPSKGFRLLPAPTTYVPIRTPSRKLLAMPTPLGTPGFSMGATPARESYGIPATPSERTMLGGAASDLPFIKPEDEQFFGALVGDSAARPEEDLSPEEARTRRIAMLVLRLKNGLPPQRKIAMRTLTEKAREFGAGPLFSAILPLLMSPSLEDQERHLLVKLIDRVLFALDDLVRPYVHKILVVIEPLLIDEDYYARVEGRELIANLAKAAGLATMISVMRPDIDSPDEYVRNTTSRAFAVVAGALGIPSLLPFLKAVTASKKSWQSRHTGCKIVQQSAILSGCAVLPHLGALIDTVAVCLTDEQQKVRIMAALALASLAEAAAPYGIESFDSVLRPLWKGVKTARGKALAANLKAVGFIIPLMDAAYAAFYTKEVMPTLLREFGTPDEEMKKIVLKTIAQCAACEGVESSYLISDVLPPFFGAFWTRRMALDRRSFRAVVDTTHALALRVGSSEVISRIVSDLKDESETYRRMVMEAIDRVLTSLGASDLPSRLEEELVDGVLYAFQEQGATTGGASGDAVHANADARIILNGFGTVVSALGLRTKPYLPQIAGTIKWRLNNKAPQVRMLAADVVCKVAPVMRACGEDPLLAHLGMVLYECLGEEYPDVLGSLLGGLRSVVSVIGITAMQPPIRDLLPRLTPILKNRAEKVQENCIDLVGRIADRGAEHVSAREWMRICFELLELLRAPRKAIRRAAVNTFGYIAKAIGPQDVLHTLLNNLKVQERTNRVCTTVAIGIVAETCAPLTVLPALMNEYRTPDMNVQNGVLKSLSFMFEYIGEVAVDYVYAVTPLLADALMDRDAVHRQIAAATVKHLTLGLQGLGAEDALQHLLNHIWPNIFETSPHVIGTVLEAIEAMRVSLGPGVIFSYVLAGLFHPARRVREVYWRIYNNLIVYAGHAMTPLYPRIPDARAGGEQGAASYRRTYLELML